MDFFNSVEHLEPKCKKCGTKLVLGETTMWSEKKQTQVCKECGEEAQVISGF